ncbi:DUF4007 family protein [Thiorhodococcus mannitoliphagus]|uniref:DUF4007 family protein n=1 Tax=Thiorhodococcus mannitoliphagus TaxID=329406 RepID=A0A6P1DUW0_9GAMM|nr:DUF4007 family protein [Thiorhodococcus mannitoliphagus]NEX21260.1 DUF4007 family protein [Thiorhodococcus mannitoliphagus]
MKLNRDKSTFGRHETFPLRHAWLTKGIDALRETPDIFSVPESAMVVLGVGRNMANAIQYWLQASGVVAFKNGVGEPTELGEVLLGDQGDRYLEDEATLWILHWLIASNAQQATGFYWFFDRFAMPRFEDREALSALTEFVDQELKARRSASTLKSDISTLLRMYAPTAERGDDHLDSPLGDLGLIEAEAGRHYRSPRLARAFLPPIALHFALAQRFQADPTQPALPIRVLLYGGDGWAAPGSIFRLNEEGLMSTLEQVMEGYPESYELRDTAGLHQLYRRGAIESPLDLLRGYHRSQAV